MTKIGYTLAILVASVAAPACTDNLTPPNLPPAGSTSGGGTDNTFDHDNDQISPWDLLQRIEIEGPPSFTSHMHGCAKVRVATLGNVLTSLGMNRMNTTALTAGELYNDGQIALGVANFPNRIRENIGISTSGASKEFDILAAGAPETIAAISGGTLARCPGVQLFDTSGATPTCTPAGITCIIGVPASATELDLCNLTIQRSSDATKVGLPLAVATMLAAAYTCE